MAENSPQPDVTTVLEAVCAGEKEAATQLLPLVYDELRNLAAARMAGTPPGQTLQPTALVHEAYLKLVRDQDPLWNGRAHFFGAAAHAMREILIDQARRKARLKRGGDRQRVELEATISFALPDGVDVLALDEALKQLEAEDALKGRIVMLRYFAGLSVAETAHALEISISAVERAWRYIKVFLYRQMYDK